MPEPIKVFIPSKGRAQTIRTHKLLNDKFDYRILVHSEADRLEYLKNPSIDVSKIIATGIEYNLSKQRNWIFDNVGKEEWFVTMDDNIDKFTSINLEAYDSQVIDVEKEDSREMFENELNADQLYDLILQDIDKMRRNGIKYGGYAVLDNYYFRAKKYRYVGYVISKVAIYQECGLRFDEKAIAMDDYNYTAENLLKVGKVLINNFIFPVAKHYEQGGLGTYEERLERKIKGCTYLMRKYPGLFRYKAKSGCHPKAEIQVRFTNLSQVNKWRKEVISLFR